jgi:hypothetical protein
MAKQTNNPKVDEDFMKEVISQGFPLKQDTTNLNERAIINGNEPAIVIPKIKEAVKRRYNGQSNYREIYFERLDFTNRQPLWLTRETHLTLLKIVNVIGGRKATLSSYVENIILQHLESHKEEINDLYENKFKRPIL